MKWFKKLLGIKEYLTCPTCSMVYEPDGMPFDDWCPEHRKPHVAQYELEQWALWWAKRDPEEARKIKAAYDAEMVKTRTAYAQELGKALNADLAKQQASHYGGLGVPNNWPLGGLTGRER